MEGMLRVAPEKLSAAAQEFGAQGNMIAGFTTEMMNLVQGLSSVWEGEEASLYMTKFKGLEDDIQKLLAKVQEHATDLEEIAQSYITTTQAIMEEEQELLSDVIV